VCVPIPPSRTSWTSSATRRQSDTLNVSTTLMLLNWHQTLFAANYSLTSAETNTTGAFALPANGDDLSTGGEVGAAPSTRRGSNPADTQSQCGYQLPRAVGDAKRSRPARMTTPTASSRIGRRRSRNSARTTSQWDIGLRVPIVWIDRACSKRPVVRRR
jgi:hypothetical protein